MSEILKYFESVSGPSTKAALTKLFRDQKFLPLSREKKLLKPAQVLLDTVAFPEVRELSPHFVTIEDLHGPLTRRSKELRTLGAKDEVTFEVVITMLLRYESGQDIVDEDREKIFVKACFKEPCQVTDVDFTFHSLMAKETLVSQKLLR